jgi:hypothetical protein
VVFIVTECPTCGADPCGTSGFCALCRKADTEKRPRQDAQFRRLRKQMHPGVTLEQAYREINDPKNRPTPQVTVEAIILTVRERGLAALKEPANIERLSRCDKAAMTQIEQRIAKLGKA